MHAPLCTPPRFAPPHQTLALLLRPRSSTLLVRQTRWTALRKGWTSGCKACGPHSRQRWLPRAPPLTRRPTPQLRLLLSQSWLACRPCRAAACGWCGRSAAQPRRRWAVQRRQRRQRRLLCILSWSSAPPPLLSWRIVTLRGTTALSSPSGRRSPRPAGSRLTSPMPTGRQAELCVMSSGCWLVCKHLRCSGGPLKLYLADGWQSEAGFRAAVCTPAMSSAPRQLLNVGPGCACWGQPSQCPAAQALTGGCPVLSPPTAGAAP